MISYRRPNSIKGHFYKREYRYDAVNDEYRCPADERLIYTTTSRDGYKHYQSDPAICKQCEYRARCTQNKKCIKTVTRHVWEEHKEQVNRNRLSPAGKQLYKRRKETVERSFADAKELHGYRYAKYRGLVKVKGQCLMAATAQNIKRIAQMAA